MRAKKELGQNFLINRDVINKIVSSSLQKKVENVLEIGPGKGALTELLVKKEKLNIIAVEIDEDLIPYLETKFSSKRNLKIILGNVLEVENDVFFKGSKYILVANLPYYIASRIIFKFLKDTNCEQMTIMLQKEMADRAIAKPNQKLYGRLTVAIQTFFDVSEVVEVDPKSFKPRPKIYSKVIKLQRKKTNEIDDIDSYLEFVKLSFSKKRKTFHNNLKSKYTSDQIKSVLTQVLPDDWNFVRSEYVNISEFKEIYKLFMKL